MAKPFNHRQPDDGLQVAAGLTQPDAADFDIANPEVASHQVIQRNIGSHQVAAGVCRRKVDFIIALERFESFSLNQCEFKIGLRFEESSLLQSVAVALEPNAWNRQYVIESLHRGLSRRGYVDRLNLAHGVPHGG